MTADTSRRRRTSIRYCICGPCRSRRSSISYNRSRWCWRERRLNAAAVIAAICIAWFAVSVSGEGKSIRLCFSRGLPGRGSRREELCWHPPRSAASACLIPCWELPCAGNGLSRSQLTFVISWPVWGLARSSHRSSWSGTHGAIRVGSQCFRPAARRFCSAQAIVRGSPGPRDATTRVDGRSVALAAAGRRRRSGRQRGARGLCSDPTRAVR